MIDGLILQLGGIPGGPELLVVLLLAVLLFGANKIPKLARSTGQAMGEFQKGREQVEQELEEMKEGADPTADSTEDFSRSESTAEPETESTESRSE
ncbi:MAG: twin-arginine translocase TatA/TatE family subunit [Halorhabdus sp.]